MEIARKILLSTRQQLFVLMLIALGLNINTLFNEYAVDDEIVLTRNKFIEKGIKGIPEIVSQGYFKGCEKVNAGEFSGGRYRPFALVIFAVEYQFFGAIPPVSHLINILLFTLLIVLLFKLLNEFVFQEHNKNLAFITCLIFAVHPVHTEVIANVKSRDELITFILLIASLISFIKYFGKKKMYLLVTSLFYFVIALFTRESAVTFLGVVPLILYFFFYQSLTKSILFSLPLFAIFIAYLLIRFSIVGLNHSPIISIENSPFLFASTSQAFATKVFILFKDIELLLFPFPLSWEYGYNQIPYINLKSIEFILSFLLIIGLIVYALFTFKQRSLFSFCILYFMINISLVSNFIADTGTPMAERLLFQASLAFCIAFAYLYLKIIEKTKIIAVLSLVILLLFFSTKTYLRNGEWKNNETLYLADVNSAPNSIRANSATSNIYISKGYFASNIELRKEYLKKAIFHAERALIIYPNNERVLKYLVSAYCGLFDCYKTIDFFIKDNKFNVSNAEVTKIYAALSDDFYRQGNGFLEQKNLDAAIKSYSKSIGLNNKHIEAYYNLGATYYLNKDTVSANRAWKEVKILDPGHIFNIGEFTQN